MTWEDEEFARRMTKVEVEDITGGGGDDDDGGKAETNYHTSAADDESNDDENEAEVMVQGGTKMDNIIQCSSCGKDGDEEQASVIEEVKDIFDNNTENSKGSIFDNIHASTEALIANDVHNPDDKLAGLKMLVKLQESGISLEYRCPSCRDCSNCKNAPDTERISLREEAEDQAMKDAVHIDYKKRKITCSLLLRGKRKSSYQITEKLL